MIKSRFLPEAETELLKEVSYYSNSAVGLGIKFATAVEEAVAMAAANPDGGSPAPHGTRKRRVNGFPFSVVYKPGTAGILIIAIMHHRRKPGYWRGRV